MDAQLSLFGDSATVHTGDRSVIARARNTDPITSHLAAAEIEATGKASDHRNIIAAFVWEHPGLTSREIAQCIGTLTHAQVWRRMAELEEEKRVIKGEKRVCTINRRLMTTWYPRADAAVLVPVPVTNPPLTAEAAQVNNADAAVCASAFSR